MEEQIKDFAVSFFKAMGASHTDHDGLLRVQLTDDQVSEIENRFSKPAVWDFVFSQQGQERFPHAELLQPGSLRMEQLIDTASAKGRLCRRYIIRGSSILRPYILFHFRLIFTGFHRPEEIWPIAIDLHIGTVSDTLYKETKDADWQTTKPPETTILPRKIGFRRAYRLACDNLRHLLQGEDHAWAESAATSLAQEKRHLQDYYRRMSAQDPQRDYQRELKQRLQEQEQRFGPRIMAYPVVTQLIFLSDG
ncbi:MAG: YqhG family protein [Limnochordia bacterium]|nr:YqhG family protein [Limnochordia bacterium]